MSVESGLRVAVVGATGAVGREMVDTLAQRDLPVSELKLLASERSEGTIIEFKDEEVEVHVLKEDSFKDVDVALFAAGGSISAKFGPIAAAAGTIVVDNSSHWRMDPDVPLIVPEVNAELVKKTMQAKAGQGFIIANPNCSTIQLVVVLKPILDNYGIKRVVCSTYQSTSGAGQKGMDELWEQTRAIYNQEEIVPGKFQHQIAFNCIPQIDVFKENGYTGEEMKMINESRKILSLPHLKMTTTTVRVPVFSCHGESVNVETEKQLELTELKDLLAESPGIIVLDDPEKLSYPMNVPLAGTDACYVGRIRKDESVENGVNMWIVADNLRKGAALNAVQIAEIVLDNK